MQIKIKILFWWLRLIVMAFGGFDNFIGDTLAIYPDRVELLSIKINK